MESLSIEFLGIQISTMPELMGFMYGWIMNEYWIISQYLGLVK